MSQISKTVLWRVGEDRKGLETCTPRTIILDERQNLGTLAQSGGPLYDEEVEYFEKMGRVQDDFKQMLTVDAWEGDAEFRMEEPKAFTDHQIALNNDLEAPLSHKDPTSLRWGDYSYTYYHPRSILVPTHDISTVQNITIDGNDEESLQFNNWLLGRNLWQRTSFRDQFEDNIRFYSEECDWMEGFQILADSAEHSGFSSLSNIVSHYIDDDYHKKVQLHFPISQFSSNFLQRRSVDPTITPSFKDWVGVLGKSMILYDLSLSTSAADAITPLCDISKNPANFYDKFDSRESMYHSSSVIAAYLETITTPFRCSDISRRIRASDIAQSLTSGHRRMFLDSKLCFRNDQSIDNFCSVSGLDIRKSMSELSYTSMPVARGTQTSQDAYFSITDKVYLDAKFNHFAPKMLKTKKNKSKSAGEVVYTDWCCSKSIGTEMRNLFAFTKQIPKYVLANLAVKYDLEMDEVSEAFIGFEDVLDEYEKHKVDSSDESSDDDY